MRRLRKCVVIIWPAAVATAFAFAACLWAVRPVFEPIGLRGHDPTAMIRHAFPIRLVQPQWISDQSHLSDAWSISEARARFAFIVACWVAACVTIIYLRVKNSSGAQT